MTSPPPKKSDLPVRTLSAVVMLAVSGTALWLGGWWWTVFVAAVALGVLWEWWGLVREFARTSLRQSIWLFGGLAYVGLAGIALVWLRDGESDLLSVIVAVIATDVGAYFSGRTFGGPKIAPTISPSKTWAGLVGGSMGAALGLAVVSWAWQHGLCERFYGPLPRFGFDGPCSGYIMPMGYTFLSCIINGAFIAIIAQTGDFFESWMKRRAGVKDSGNLIPGHGGLFDRVDGLLAVLFVLGLFMLVTRVLG